MIPEIVPIVCFSTGSFCGCPDLYLSRLYGMLSRHMPLPFTLTCVSDRPRPVPYGVEMKDCKNWTEIVGEDIHPTMVKLHLFDGERDWPSEFIYLDMSLVIRGDMTPLLEYAFSQEEDLVIVNDWNYPCYNSSVMRIRSGRLGHIYDAFVAGKRYAHNNKTDQDFIYKYLADQSLQECVSLFPAAQVVSYRKTRSLNRTDTQAARRTIEDAIIVKFHGRPKMHQVANPLYNLFKIRLRNRRYGARDAAFFLPELRREWRA